MGEHLIFTGTVTYAIKGRDILRRNGINAAVKKIAGAQSGVGCGYAIAVKGDIRSVERLLYEGRIKILKIDEI